MRRRLKANEIGVLAVFFDQRLVRPHFDDLGIFHHDDAIGIFNRRKTVSDRKARAALHQVIECILDVTFTFAIQGTRGFVQNQNRCVFQNGASNRDALLLTAREFVARFTHRRIETVG